MVLFGVATYFSFLFYEGENQVRTKKTPKDSMLGKKAVHENLSLGPGIRLPIGKVPHVR